MEIVCKRVNIVLSCQTSTRLLASLNVAELDMRKHVEIKCRQDVVPLAMQMSGIFSANVKILQ